MKTKNFLRVFTMGLMLLLISHFVRSQVNYEFLTPQELAVQHLVEPGAVVSNISFFGDSLQFAYLSNLSEVGYGFGLPSAVCLSSSVAPGLIYGFDYPPFLPDISAYTPPWFSGPNHAEDGEVFEDILAVSQETVDMLGFDFMDTILFDAAWIEFDVIATSSNLTFSYILSGNEFSRSSGCEPGENSWSYAGDCYFHDAFAIFVSGPDITGPYHSPPQFQGSVNVATVPGSNPVLPVHTKSINDVLNSDLWINYGEEYYNNNGCDFDNPCDVPPALWTWGFSQVLTNTIEVTCGQIYHVRIAMADIFDHIYESFWMLAPIGGTANGTQNPEVNISFVPQGEMVNQVFEDCNPAWLNITRSAAVSINTPDTVFLYPEGIAINGADYELLPEFVIIPAGQQTISVPINITNDGISEGDEILTIAALEAHNLNQDCAISAYVQINDGPDPIMLTGSEVVLCNPEMAVLEPIVQGGYGQYTYTWYDGSTDPSMVINDPDPDAEYFVIVDDTCGTEADTLWFDLIDLDLLAVEFSTDTIDYSCNTSMEVSAEISGGYGEILYSWSPYNPTSNEATYYFNNSDGPQTVYLEVIDGCNQIVTDSVFMYSPFEMPFGYYGDPVVSADCGDTFEFVPALDGGIGPYFSYFINGMDIQAGESASYEISDTTLVTVLAADACGQNFFTTVTIVPFTAGPLDYSLPDMLPLICSGGTDVELVVEDGFGNIEYVWTDESGQILSETADWIYTGADEVMLYVSASDECGQTLEDSLLLASFYIPLGITLPDSMIVPCAAEASLSVDISNGQSPYEVIWYHNGSVLGNGPVIQNLFFLESTSVEVEVTDACGIVQSDMIWIEAVAEPLVVESIADVSVLCGQSINLSAIVEQSNGAYYTSWWSDGQLLSETGELVLEDVAGPMNIVLSVSDECGQEWQQEVNVQFEAGVLSIDLPESIELSCAETLVLEPSIMADNDFSAPSWYVDGVYSSQGESYLFDELQSTWISCEVMDICGNFAVDSTWVIVAPGEMSVNVSDTVICLGGTAELQAIVTGGTGQLVYWWNGNIGYSEEEFFVDESSVIEVMVEDICGLTATDEAEITVLELTPEIGIEELPGGYSLQVVDTCLACSYTWSMPDGSTLSSQVIEYYPVSGSDNVILLEVNNGVCNWSGFWHFEAESAIYVPNAFTPDGDGVNDVFSVSATGLDNFDCFIFDRWGEIVFTSSDPSFAWTGDVQGGGYYAPDGVYTWVIHAGNGMGESWVKRGSVVLIR